MPSETSDEYTRIEQDQRDAHSDMPVMRDDPLYADDVDGFEMIDATH